MGKEKLGFFKKMFLVITDFRTYPFLVKHEKIGKSIGYFILLLLFLSIFLSLTILVKFESIAKYLIDNYEDIPDFVFANKELIVEEPLYSILDTKMYLMIDTNYSFDEFADTKEFIQASTHDISFVFNKDRVTILLNGVTYSYLPFEQFEGSIDKEQVYQSIVSYREDYLAKVQLFIIVYASLAISYLSSMVFKLILIAFLASFMCMSRGIRLNFSNYFKIAIYAYTFPLIVEIAVTCLVGPGKSYTYWATVLLLYVYLLYAIRAIRLDAFIMMFSRKNNVRHTSAEFESELEKYKEMVEDPVDFQKNSDEDSKNTEDEEDVNKEDKRE